MTKRYFSGASEAQAVLEAAAHFGVPPEKIAYEPVSRKGSLRARTKSIIAVEEETPTVSEPQAPVAAEAPVSSPEATEPGPGVVATAEPAPPPVAETTSEVAVASSEDEAASSDSTSEDSPESTPVVAQVVAPGAEEDSVDQPPDFDPEEVRTAILSSVELLLDLADLDVDPSVDVGQDPPCVNVSGPDREWLLDGEGDLLLALEHLVGRMLYRGGCPVDRVRVDSDGFREGQDDALRERTRKALAESTENGRAVVFEPLGPAERRVIHLEVERLGGGWSRSEGSGFRRRVRIEATPDVGSEAAVSGSVAVDIEAEA